VDPLAKTAAHSRHGLDSENRRSRKRRNRPEQHRRKRQNLSRPTKTNLRETFLHSFYLTKWHAQDLAAVRETIPAIYDFKTKRYTAAIRAGAVELNPGVARLIGEAKAAGARLAIATTSHRDNVEALLQHTLPEHGAALFDAVVAGDEVSAKKPDPEVFEAALRKLRLPAASCVAFEDAAHGANAARGAALRVVVTPGIYTADDDFSGATSVVSDLGEPGRLHQHLAGWKWPDGYVSFAALRTKTEEGPA